MTSDRRDRSNPAVVGFHQNTGSLLQDSAGLLTINGFALPAKLAEKRKLIEEFAHNDVKKVSMIYFTISFFHTCALFLSDLLVFRVLLYIWAAAVQSFHLAIFLTQSQNWKDIFLCITSRLR